MATKVEIARCPSCHRAIFADHPYPWCKECGEPLPADILQMIPSLQRRVAAAAEAEASAEAARAEIARREEAERPAYKSAERFAIANPGRLTVTILVACVAIAWPTLTGEQETMWARSYAWGAQINSEVDAGEWWRLLSAAFLHGGWGHLVGNMYALFVLGSVVEYTFGAAAFLVIYVLAALGGGVASYIFLDAPTVGASGAIFGLSGALLWLLRPQQDRPRVPLSRSQLGGLGWWAAYSLVRGFTDAHINNAAHLGGFATGAAVAAAIPSARAASALAPLCVTMLALTGVRMGLSARETPRVEAYVRATEAMQRKDTEAALRELDRAVPFANALSGRAALRLNRGDYRGALADADALLASGRRGESRRAASYLKAAALFKLGSPTEALSVLQPALGSRRSRLRAAASRLDTDIRRALPDAGVPASVRALHIEPSMAQ